MRLFTFMYRYVIIFLTRDYLRLNKNKPTFDFDSSSGAETIFGQEEGGKTESAKIGNAK